MYSILKTINMKNTLLNKIIPITLFIITCSFNCVTSQEIIDYFHKKNGHLLEEKINQLNKLAEGTNTFEIKDGTNLIASFYEDGKVYRKDEIYLETLNPDKISFSSKEDAIICKCKSKEQLNKRLKRFREGCVQRHIIKNNILRAYLRINFKINGDKEEFMEIMKELVVSAWTYQ